MADPHFDQRHSDTRAAARRSGTLANILAIVGFIILMIIVIWGLVHLARLSAPWLSDVFRSDKKGSITVNMPSRVEAGTPLSFSWKYTSTAKGTYAFLYQCVEGLQYAIPSGDRATPIPCGAAFTLGNSSSSATVIPMLTGTTSVRSNISILYIPSAAGSTGPAASGSAIVEVVKGGTPANPPQGASQSGSSSAPVRPGYKPPQKPAAPKPVQKPAPKPATPADLSVRIVAVGVIDPYTGAFVQRAPYSTNEISAVQFDIKNVGGTASGIYTFAAQIPTSQPYTYTSVEQYPLAPGAHVINTLRFSPAVNGTFSVTVYGDSYTGNNYASQWVTGAYEYGYPYPQYPAYQYPWY